MFNQNLTLVCLCLFRGNENEYLLKSFLVNLLPSFCRQSFAVTFKNLVLFINFILHGCTQSDMCNRYSLIFFRRINTSIY